MTIKVDDSISLELLDYKHTEVVFSIIESNRMFLKEWLPWVDYMKSAEDFKNYIGKTKQQADAGSDFGFVIFFNNIVAGRIGIHYIDQQNKIGSLGYWLGEEFAGKGIITKACKAIIHYAFDTLLINRIEIKCGTENYKSMAIPERLKFKQEGILKQAELVNGQFIDLFLFSMLKQDWGN